MASILRQFSTRAFAAFLCMSLCFSNAIAGAVVADTAGQAVYRLLDRLLPGRRSDFRFEELRGEQDGFEIESRDGKIVIRGSDGVAMASGLSWYLEKIANCQISLNFNRLELPAKLPEPHHEIKVSTPFEYRYFFNYCTYGYTMPWWDWPQWERMIDYMALKGINMPLAMIGQEAVWEEVFRDFGLSEKQIADFFVGPAHLPWGWMGNIDGVGGPLPKKWIAQRKVLQKKILARMRSFGMKPVLQAFTGHVPEALRHLYPESRIFQINDWAGITGTWFLDPTDSLFRKIGTAFIKKQTEMYGTDHLYDADCFIEVDPPSGDPDFLKEVSSSVYASMRNADPEATWVLQGWFFFFKKDFWTPERGRAFLEAIPKDKVIVLDLYGEKFPTWRSTDAFYGQPWIWNVICNEDQKVNMSGDLAAIDANFRDAYTSEIQNNLKGIGVIPEGLGYNPMVLDFVFDKVWNQESVSVEEWLRDYVIRRYGHEDRDALSAWKHLSNSVYARTRTMWSPLLTTPRLMILQESNKEDERHVRAEYTITDDNPFAWDFDVMELASGADRLLRCAERYEDLQTYRFDLTNVWRELLHSLTHTMINDISIAYAERDMAQLDVAGAALLKLIDDLDEITGTNDKFLLGKWLSDARRWATSKEEEAYYEWNARTIITIWQPWKDGDLRDYAGKQWNGLLKGYHKPRWALLIDHLKSSLKENREFDPHAFDRQVRELDFKWTHATDIYPDQPVGDIVEIARRIRREYARYFDF